MPQAEQPGDGAVIDPMDFIKPLEPDQLGVFEPLSCLMLLNLPDTEFRALIGRWTAGATLASDTAVIRTINHEAYHFAQVAGSGYAYDRQRQSLAALNAAEPLPDEEARAELSALHARFVAAHGDDAELRHRVERSMMVATGVDRAMLLNDRALAGDHSMAGAMMPGLFRHLQALAERERIANANGLSITGLLEGSAVVHAALLIHAVDDAHVAIEAELATLPPVYGELVALTAAATGSRALELLLPATALALRYTEPHHAYGPLLGLLAESAPGEALEHGRALAARLPHIATAGPLLGTAVEVRAAHEDYRGYDVVLDKLATGQWGIDSYELLANPKAIYAMGGLPFGIVTADGYHGGRYDAVEMAARMQLMALVMRVQSRRRAERDFGTYFTDWGREWINRMASELPADD